MFIKCAIRLIHVNWRGAISRSVDRCGVSESSHSGKEKRSGRAREDNNLGSLRHRMINKSGMPLREQFNLWPSTRCIALLFIFPRAPSIRICSHAARESSSRGPKRTSSCWARVCFAALLSAFTTLQIRIANGPFPQALTLNVNCCLNLWQSVPLLFFFPDPFGLLSRRPTLHSTLFEPNNHGDCYPPLRMTKPRTSPMISDSGIVTKCV